MSALQSILVLFKEGYEVKNPHVWQKGIWYANIGAFAVVAVALLKALGVPVALSDDQLVSLAGILLAGANVVVPVISDARRGVPAPGAAEPNQPEQGTADPSIRRIVSLLGDPMSLASTVEHINTINQALTIAASTAQTVQAATGTSVSTEQLLEGAVHVAGQLNPTVAALEVPVVNMVGLVFSLWSMWNHPAAPPKA